MHSKAKIIGISAFVGLIVGFLLGFIPAHIGNSDLSQTNSTLTQSKSDLQGQLNRTAYQLHLSQLASHAGLAYADADRNNFSVAGNEASQLFTSLRQLSDQSSDPQLKQGLGEILALRDSTIAALAKADPAVKQRLQEIFRKMLSISAANR